jgi:beta-glucosidase
VGVHQALSPMADLATEPRWPRINGTFGEDPMLSERLVKAYVEGFQHGDSGVAADAVSAVAKHWVGYGAARNGYDSHNAYGKNSALTATHLAEYVEPFLGAFAARVAGVMPTYSVLVDLKVNGQLIEPVGAGFNHYLLTDLLRDTYHFKGIVVSDWAIVNDCDVACRSGFPSGVTPNMAAFSTAWGVEGLSAAQRVAKALNAGVDQLGGVDDPTALLEAVHDEQVSSARIDQFVQSILTLKFQQGLFDNPYVDEQRASRIAGSAAFVAAGRAAQSHSLVILEELGSLLPLKPRKLFLYGVSAEVAEGCGFTVVSDLKSADAAVIRLTTPYETLHPNYAFGMRQHEGDLAFHDGNPGYQVLRAAWERNVITIVSVYLDRPAILTNIRDKASLLLADFGVSDAALFDVLTGKETTTGRLPIELPASMAAVIAQRSDAPHDSADALYPIFSGRRPP